MNLITPVENKIHVVQDTSKFKWAGVPFKDRYALGSWDDAELMKQIHKIDDLLDIRFYYPTQKWRLIRYPYGRLNGFFVCVWELDDRPDLGLRKTPGSWMIEALRMADTWGRAANREHEVEANNKEVDASKQRTVDDACGEAAKELRKPLQHAADYGLNSEYKGVF